MSLCLSAVPSLTSLAKITFCLNYLAFALCILCTCCLSTGVNPQLTFALGPLLDNDLLSLKSSSALDIHRRGMKIKILHL